MPLGRGVDRVLARHKKHRDSDASIGECWDCGRQRSKCRAKVQYEDWVLAQEAADEQNVKTGWQFLLLCYECDWCSGYHVARARGSARIRSVKKRRVRHFIMTERRRD